MIITRVCLTNYNKHKKLEINFTEKINLILGDNGSGKSSIIEALGLVLYGAKPRNGLQGAIRNGEENGDIEIEFIGTDKIEYIASRPIQGGGLKFNQKDTKESITDEKEKYKICGIKDGADEKNVQNIYENIIVARQNELVDPFKETPANRTKIFNKIFDFGIYGVLADSNNGYLFKALKKYEHDRDISEGKKEGIEKKDEKELEQNLIELKGSSYNLTKEKSILDEKIKDLNTNIEEYNTLENDKKLIENDIKNYNDKVKALKFDIEKCKKYIQESEEAKKIVDDNKDACDKYGIIKKKIEELKPIFKEKETIYNNYQDKKTLKQNNETTISEIKGKIKVNQANIENESNTLNTSKQNLSDTKNEIIRNQKLENEYSSKKNILENKIKELDDLNTEINNFNNNKTEEKARYESAKKIYDENGEIIKELQDKDIAKKLEEIENLESNLKDDIKNLKDDIDKLEKQNTEKITRIDENNSANEKLGKKECPYLHEQCQNLKDLKDNEVSNFFEKRNNNLKNEIDINNQEIEKIKEKIENIKLETQDKISMIGNKNDLLGDKIKLKNLLDDHIEPSDEELKKLKNKLKQLNEKYAIILKESNYNTLDEIKNKNTIIGEKIKNLDREILTLTSKKNDLETQIIDLQSKIGEFGKSNNALKKEKEKIDIQQQNIKNYMKEHENIESEYNGVKSQLDDETTKLEELQQAYDLYNQNLKKSSEIEKHKDNLKNKKDALTEVNDNLKTKTNELNKKAKELEKYDIRQLNEDKQNLETERDKKNNAIGEIVGNIKQLKKEIETNKENIKRYNKLEKEIKLLKEKIDFTITFRDKIKNMGKEVSKYTIEKIARIATENYRKISGGNEIIRWEEGYQVYMNDKEFKSLSGGEQVSVALSIRGAMTDHYTTSKFAIFDEPTNNLDEKRKANLAEKFPEILKDLDQSIIVTHDDTFREMANNVIDLNEICANG